MFHNNFDYTNLSVTSNISTQSSNSSDFEFTFAFIPCDDIEFFPDVLGQGSFGYVKKARWRGQIVAVKYQMDKQFQIEAQQLSKIKHENIITVFGYSVHNDNHVIVMEYAKGGCLAAVLSNPQYRCIQYTLSHAISWCLQCARGVNYLHLMKPKPLIHRDLKPLNLLLNENGLILKICDFGTACDKKTYMTNNKGSCAWMAPEVFKGTDYSEKCDIFSWAIILWQCLSRKQPFHKYENEFAIQWAKGALNKKPPMFVNCPSKLRCLLTMCWDQNPEVRPPMSEVVTIMEELFSHCSRSKLYPLQLVPNQNENVPFINISNLQSSLFNNTMTGTNNNLTSFNRRISDDNLASRETLQERQILQGHRRSNSSDASLILDTIHDNVPADESAVDDEEIASLLRNFNAYLVLNESHHPIQPDIRNSESISIFEEHRQMSVRLLRLTFQLSLLESYIKDLEKWKNDPNRDDAGIYMRFCDENRNLKNMRAAFAEQLIKLRTSRNTSGGNPNSNEDMVHDGWVVVNSNSANRDH